MIELPGPPKEVDHDLPRVGSAGLVIDDNGRILLGRRAKIPNFGKWVLPGGKIEPYESIARALSREVQEETGLLISVGEQAGVFEIVHDGEEHRIIVYSWARPVAGQLRPSSDLSEVLFATVDEASALDLSDFVRAVLSAVGWLGKRRVASRRRAVTPHVARRRKLSDGRGLQIELGL